MKTRNRGQRHKRSLILCLVILLTACGGTLYTQDIHLIGSWGGDHMRMIIGEKSAITEYDCGSGTIDEPLIPDKNGRFTVRGTHVLGHGGPSREGELPDRHPAWYEGSIKGREMILTVTLSDTGLNIGKFRLMFGSPGRLFRCY